jgi:hypothetical protein
MHGYILAAGYHNQPNQTKELQDAEASRPSHACLALSQVGVLVQSFSPSRNLLQQRGRGKTRRGN